MTWKQLWKNSAESIRNWREIFRGKSFPEISPFPRRLLHNLRPLPLHFRGRVGEEVLSTIGRDRSGVFEAHPGTPVPPTPLLLIFTTESKHPTDSRGHDKGDRRSGGVERKDPGRIRQALNRSGSGQVGHGPWEWGVDLTSHSPRCFRMAWMTSRSSIKLMIRMIPPHFGQVRGSTFPDQVEDRLRFSE